MYLYYYKVLDNILRFYPNNIIAMYNVVIFKTLFLQIRIIVFTVIYKKNVFVFIGQLFTNLFQGIIDLNS